MHAVLLRDGGLDAEHFRDHGPQAEPDVVILAFAREHEFVMVSMDPYIGAATTFDTNNPTLWLN